MKHGFVIVNKSAGLTSHDCVGKLRRIFHQKRIGHSGTLDPNVTGVLPLALGQATKLIELLVDSGKIYEGDICLGYSTTTEDVWGEMVEQCPLVLGQIKDEEIDQALKSLTGEIEQIPPMYSAVKVKGKRLYEYARAGEEVERPRRHVVIEDFLRLSKSSYDAEKKCLTFSFRVSCSKGTYVRTLATQVGELLGLPAHLSRLCRLKSGGFSLEESHSIASIEENPEAYFIPLQVYIEKNFKSLDIPFEFQKLACNGGPLPNFAHISDSFPRAVYVEGKLIGLYTLSSEEEKTLRPFKMFDWRQMV